MARQPLKLSPLLAKRKRVVNLSQYFDWLRARVPGLLSAQSKRPRRGIIELIHERSRARRAHA
jgi:hypothetical protein